PEPFYSFEVSVGRRGAGLVWSSTCRRPFSNDRSREDHLARGRARVWCEYSGVRIQLRQKRFDRSVPVAAHV
ncbi:MAG: hypothetical protein ACRD2X_23845, partial [Vicinamibacteraceae bacterium]